MFDSYLEDVFLRKHPEVTKDNFENAYDRWLSTLEVSDVIEYANRAMDDLYKQNTLL